MAVLSSLHPDSAVLSNENAKKKSDSVLFYNKIKVEVDVLDQIARLYLVKAASRWWPMHVFYFVIDMALFNSWIVYMQVCQSSTSRREFIEKVVEELTGTSGSATTMSRKRRAEEMSGFSDRSAASVAKRHLTCSTSKCRNQTTDLCQECSNHVCGKCASKKCKLCE